MTPGSKSLGDEEDESLIPATQAEKNALQKMMSEVKNSRNITQIGGFLKALETTDGIDNKKITLWRQIYQQAIDDRSLAEVIYTNLYIKLAPEDLSHHGIYGPVLVKYLERMNKSTDQLLKLSELLANELDKLEVINNDDVFDQIGDK